MQRADASSKCCSNQGLYKGCANKMATRVRQQLFFFLRGFEAMQLSKLTFQRGFDFTPQRSYMMSNCKVQDRIPG
jgi:hypothetical protein